MEQRLQQRDGRLRTVVPQDRSSGRALTEVAGSGTAVRERRLRRRQTCASLKTASGLISTPSVGELPRVDRSGLGQLPRERPGDRWPRGGCHGHQILFDSNWTVAARDSRRSPIPIL